MKSKHKLSIRLNDNQMVVLSELSESLGVSISVLVRTIIYDFLQRNEDHLYNLIDERKKITMEDINQNANDSED